MAWHQDSPQLPCWRHGWSEGAVGAVPSPGKHSLPPARRNKCCSTHPAGVCSPCHTQTHTTPARGPLRGWVSAPCRAPQRQSPCHRSCCASCASTKEGEQEKQRIVKKCCEFRMWDFSFSTHLQNGSTMFMAFHASFMFPPFSDSEI